MALRKVTGAQIVDSSITSANIIDGAITANDIVNDIAFNGTAIRVPAGTTAQRPASPATGQLRYNTTVAVLEQYTTDGWVGVEPAPTISNIQYPGSQTAIWQGDTLTVNGTGFRAGAVVKFLNPSTGITTQADSTTRISSTQVTAVFPTSVSTEGTYTVVVTNPSGLGATLDNALIVDGNPIWTTGAGSIGSFLANETMSTTVAATEDGASIVSFALVSGSLPTGVSLNTTTGVISGIPSDVSGDTVYSFSLKATDVENQSTTRAFTLTVLENYQVAGSSIFG